MRCQWWSRSDTIRSKSDKTNEPVKDELYVAKGWNSMCIIYWIWFSRHLSFEIVYTAGSYTRGGYIRLTTCWTVHIEFQPLMKSWSFADSSDLRIFPWFLPSLAGDAVGVLVNISSFEWRCLEIQDPAWPASRTPSGIYKYFPKEN